MRRRRLAKARSRLRLGGEPIKVPDVVSLIGPARPTAEAGGEARKPGTASEEMAEELIRLVKKAYQ